MTFVEECADIVTDGKQGFSETPAFSTKSSKNPTKWHPCLKVFLSQVRHELFEIIQSI